MASPPLRIGIDGRELIGKPTGVGRYLRQVLDIWQAADDFPHVVTIVLPGPVPPALSAALPKIHWTAAPSSASAGTLWEQTTLPGAIAHADLDVFFAAGYTAPLRMPCPFVVAIYDVSFFAHPEWFRFREGLRRRWLTKRAAHRAASVITISEFSAHEIVRWLGVSRHRIRLAAPGVPRSAPTTSSAREPVVLFVGSIFNRRHVVELIQSLALVRRDIPEARLVLVGDNRTRPTIDLMAVATAAGVRDAVEWREYVGDGDLAALYSSARAFAFLSDYEGFAMTPMEALAQGVPSVLLDTPVAREIYADGVLRVPLQTRAIADALISLLSDDLVRSRVLASARAQAANYSWNRCADAIQIALEEAAAQ